MAGSGGLMCRGVNNTSGKYTKSSSTDLNKTELLFRQDKEDFDVFSRAFL